MHCSCGIQCSTPNSIVIDQSQHCRFTSVCALVILQILLSTDQNIYFFGLFPTATCNVSIILSKPNTAALQTITAINMSGLAVIARTGACHVRHFVDNIPRLMISYGHLVRTIFGICN